MNDALTVTFWIIFIFGIYRMLFQNLKQGCVIIIIALVVGNIFIDETSFEKKPEITKKANTEVEREQTNRNKFYSPTNNYHDNPKIANEENISSYGEVSINDDLNSGYAEDDETDEEYNVYIQDNQTSENNYSNSSSNSGVRVGAICNDGTTSIATGSGACSHHGGVSEWIYE